ncbi:ornithine cyclodeaminase family protein [Streptomyces sp. ISL-11]|uniref:ornithine cyclodeaminase family protein n=1 Tax=Streptomyces sp. ISL-11 TaxID=2819174 RepID=UPI001BE849E8|nr:ornithine cyclodeaminase family protein [Streptomyces sp. ISL-11]MBT2384466.1 ornithine cyclodeaminase family protein [Streptomyces sp. ISL-11]
MRPETLLLTQDDLNEILDAHGRHAFMDLVIERLHEALVLAHHSRTATPSRAGVRRCPQETGVLEWMPHHESGRCLTVKTVGYTPTNPSARGLPTILATLTRFDDETGHLVAVCDGVLPTAIRTGAASAVASRLLAHPDSATLGLIGAGAQAITQLHAVSRAFRLRDVLVHDIDPARGTSLAERAAFLGLDIRVATVRQIEESADIICTATSVGVGAGPALDGTHLRPHVHFNAIGADLPGKTELPVEVLRSALVVPDHLEQARREGECQQLKPAEIGPDLPTLLASPAEAVAHQGRWTVFDSTGYALEDHAILDVLLELAEKYGLGQRVRVEHLPADALNPYEG